MATTELPHPTAAEFAAIRADLARLYLAHKADLQMGEWPDEAIIARVNDITSTLIVLAKAARANDDTAWLLRHRWFFAACRRMFDGDDAAPLDG